MDGGAWEVCLYATIAYCKLVLEMEHLWTTIFKWYHVPKNGYQKQVCV